METTKKLPKNGIKLADTEAINDYLKSVNGRALSFVVCAGELQHAAEKAEGDLDSARLPMAQRIGIELHYRTAGPSANAYRYSVIGNEAWLKRFRDGWRLLDFKTTSVFPRQNASTRVRITEEHAAEIRRRCLMGFEIIGAPTPDSGPADVAMRAAEASKPMGPDQRDARSSAA